MSTTIAILGPMGLDDLQIAGAESRFDGEGVWHFHIAGRSTREVRVHVQPDKTDVQMYSMSAPEDVALGVALAERAAELIGAVEVDAELFGTVGVSELRDCYGAAWIDAQLQSGERVLRALVADGKGPLEIPGPQRSVYVGSRVLAETGNLLELMRRVQWTAAATASVFLTGDERRLAIWLGDEVVMPVCDLVALGDAVVVPSERVPELAGDAWQWLDERQGLIEALGSRWERVVEAARRFAA